MTAAETAIVPKAAPHIGVGNRGLQLLTLDDMYRFSKYVVASGLAPKSYRTPEQVLVAIQQGAELGFGHIQSLHSFFVIGGVPRLMVEPAMALILSSGLLEARSDRFEGEGLKRTAIVAFARKGGKLAVERRFSVEDAKRARLEGNDNWKNYPDRMLLARATGWAAHDLFPDVLRGIRIAETMDDFEPHRPAEINVTPRATAGPDPVLAMLDAPAASFELPVQDAVPVEAVDAEVS